MNIQKKKEQRTKEKWIKPFTKEITKDNLYPKTLLKTIQKINIPKIKSQKIKILKILKIPKLLENKSSTEDMLLMKKVHMNKKIT